MFVRGMDGISQHADPFLRVKNVAPFDLLIERFEVKPSYCGIASGSDIKNILKAASGSDVPILLAPLEERELLLVITVRDRSKVKDDEKARRVFERTAKNRPRVRLTIRQRTRVLEQWPKPPPSSKLLLPRWHNYICRSSVALA